MALTTAHTHEATHRFWTCVIAGCNRPAAIDIGGCERCQAMYCARHIDSEKHKCQKDRLDEETWLAAQTAELMALANKVDEDALLRRARELSGGRVCHLDSSDPLGRRLMGGMHVHRKLLFDDGTVWLVRMLRENYTSFDDGTSNQILLSECATLQWLAEYVDGLPTPRLHGFGLRGDADNAVGVAYMLIDQLPGQPFQMSTASAEQKAKVLGQWADMLCVLGQHPLDRVGSLQFQPAGGNLVVGPVASDRTGTLPCTLGPYADARDFYHAWVRVHQDAIHTQQLFSRHSEDSHLMFQWIDEQVSSVDGRGATPFTDWNDLHAGPFFLRHVDDKGDHLLVDEDYNITGVIDWTFARTAPAYEAFGPALVTANMGHLISGHAGLSDDDSILRKALQDRKAPYCYFDADQMRRLIFGLGVGFGLSQAETMDTFRGLVATWSGGRDMILDWNVWKTAFRVRIPAHILPPPVARFTTCAYDSNCRRPGVRGSSCRVCGRHLCALHRLPPYHTCKPLPLDDDAWNQGLTDEVEALLAKVNIPALERRASTLRNGVACKFIRGQHLGSDAMMGCANYHAWIVFVDGVRWLARIPRTTDGSDLPRRLVDHLVASEYATLRYIEQEMSGTVVVPRAHGFGRAADLDNAVGVAYLLEDALPGRPFSVHGATLEQKQHVYSQYADILAELSRHPLRLACSLVPSDKGGINTGPVASDRFVRMSQHGPYQDAESFYSSVADLHIDLIADGQIYLDYPREAYTFYRLLRNRAAPVLAADVRKCKDVLPGFYLKHVDDKGDHILVDSDYNITGIIDWQFARFVPAVEAFGPSLFTADMGCLYDGKSGLSADDQRLAALFREKGRDDLADMAESSELARRFHFGLASGLTKDDALAMLGAVLTILVEDYNNDLAGWVEAEWAKAGEEKDWRWQQIKDRMDNLQEVQVG